MLKSLQLIGRRGWRFVLTQQPTWLSNSSWFISDIHLLFPQIETCGLCKNRAQQKVRFTANDAKYDAMKSNKHRMVFQQSTELVTVSTFAFFQLFFVCFVQRYLIYFTRFTRNFSHTKFYFHSQRVFSDEITTKIARDEDNNYDLDGSTFTWKLKEGTKHRRVECYFSALTLARVSCVSFFFLQDHQQPKKPAVA